MVRGAKIASAEWSILWNDDLTFTFLLKRKQERELVLREEGINYSASGHSNVIERKQQGKKVLIFLFSTETNIRILPRRSSSLSEASWKMYPSALECSQNSILGKVQIQSKVLDFLLLEYYLFSNGKQENSLF